LGLIFSRQFALEESPVYRSVKEHTVYLELNFRIKSVLLGAPIKFSKGLVR
jgi:hypothetical protein